MAKLRLTESKDGSYLMRTKRNAENADVTIACALDFTTTGEKATKKAACDAYLSFNLLSDPLETARTLYRYCVANKVKTINIAGNGLTTLSKHGYSQRRVNLWVYQVFSLVHRHYPLARLVSGGQTGVDISAAVVGPLLSIDTEINFPLMFRQRIEGGVDITQSEDEVLANIRHMHDALVEDVAKHHGI